jgi:hypothetical protein
VGPDLAFVVDGSSGVDGVGVGFGFSDRGLEGGSGPEIERLGGLDVVVAVDQDGGAIGFVVIFGQDDRVAGGGLDGCGEAGRF